MPSYGPEIRGGTANCVTIISDQPVSSPIISCFDSAIILNQPSMDKFEDKVKPDGLLLYETTNILTPPSRTDITVQGIPAAEEAAKMDNSRIMNMIMLGAFLAHRPVLTLDSVMAGLAQVLPERYHNLLPLNKTAIELGMALALAKHEA